MIHLQFVGNCNSIAVKDAKPGMKIMFNWGYVYEIIEVRPVKKSILLRVRNPETGQEYSQLKRPDTQIAAYFPKKKGGEA